nr:hypothetical protein [Tanacetum cinerariifolium]
MKKDTEGPEALNFTDFGNIHGGRALQDLDEFCRVSFRHEDRTFTSQAWNRLFRIQNPVIHEYVLEFLSTIHFKDHVVKLDVVDTVVFQPGCLEKSKIVGAHIVKRIARSLGLMSNVSLRVVTMGQDTSLLDVVKLVELVIISYNGLGQGEIVDDKLDDSEDEVDAAEARRA